MPAALCSRRGPLRPGQLYFCKNYAPDSAPDTYNIEIDPATSHYWGARCWMDWRWWLTGAVVGLVPAAGEPVAAI